MNKRFALALTAILCAIAICAAMIPALSVFADGETAEDAVWIEGVTAPVNDPFHVTGFFHVDYLFDGATDGLGWHATADGSLTPTVDTPTVIDADLHGTYNVWILAIYPMDFYSADLSVVPPVFELQLSADNGATWETVVTETEASCTVNGEPLIYVLDEAFQATNFRMLVQSNGPVLDGTILTAIGEIEIWGVEVEVPETETQAPAVTETQAPTVTETEAPEETVVETVVESDVESADESEEIVESAEEESAEESANETVVDETVAETVAGETTADTTAATDAPAADAEEGCASVVGFGAVAVLAAAAAFVFKKKD